MQISINEKSLGVVEAVIDDLPGWHVPLTVYGEYEPSEPAEEAWLSSPSSFRIDLAWVEAKDDLKLTFYNSKKDALAPFDLDAVQQAICDYLEED